MTLRCSTSTCAFHPSLSQRMPWNAFKQKHNKSGVQRIRPLGWGNRPIAQAVGKASLKKGDAEGAVELAFAELLNTPEPHEFLSAFVDAALAMNKIPTIIIDEANQAFPNGESSSKREAASRALATFVATTKEQCQACVILAASDYAFPYGLATLGFNKYDVLGTMVIPEVEMGLMLPRSVRKVLASIGLPLFAPH